MRPLPRYASMAAALAAVLSSAGAASAAPSDAFTQALSKGPLYAGIAAFVGGLGVSLTPCVYPMVAVTVSVFGGGTKHSRARGFALSAMFVLGLVAMFTPLGVVAGMTGSVSGELLNNPWVVSALAVLFVAMAASMFGAFDLALPSGLNNRLARMGGMGFKGAFVLGLICGPIAAPCTGPVLTGILSWIAKSANPWLGAAAMSAFSLGLGVPFFLVGAFAVQLPKSGRWMVHVKSVFGIVLLVAALYFASIAFPVLTRYARPTTTFLLTSAGLVALGLLLGGVHRSFDEPGVAAKARKGVGILLATVGGFALIAGAMTPVRTLSWEKTTAAAAERKARAEKRPLLVDFTASWCFACKEIDKETFANEEVAHEAGRFVAVKVDATDDEDPAVVSAMKRYGVLGLPTVVVFDSAGKERVRFTDFVSADRFLTAIRKVD